MFPQRRMTTDTPDGNYSQALNLFVRGEGGWVQMPSRSISLNDYIREEAYNTGYSEAEAQRASTPAPGKTLPQLLEQLNAGECKGIKSATAYKIEEFARQQGYLE